MGGTCRIPAPQMEGERPREPSPARAEGFCKCLRWRGEPNWPRARRCASGAIRRGDPARTSNGTCTVSPKLRLGGEPAAPQEKDSADATRGGMHRVRRHRQIATEGSLPRLPSWSRAKSELPGAMVSTIARVGARVKSCQNQIRAVSRSGPASRKATPPRIPSRGGLSSGRPPRRGDTPGVLAARDGHES